MTKGAAGRRLPAPMLPSIPPILKQVTNATALSAAFVGATYAFGLIIVSFSSWTSGYGNVDFSRVRYVTVGCCFAFLVALLALPAFIVGRWSTHHTYNNSSYKLPFIVTCGLLAFSMLLSSGIFFFILDSQYVRWLPWLSWCGGLCAMGISTGVFIEIAKIGIAESSRAKTEPGIWKICRFCVLVSVPLFFAITINIYAKAIYPAIEPAFGGGAFPSIELLACKDDTGKSNLENYLEPEACKFPQKYRLIDQNETHLLVETYCLSTKKRNVQQTRLMSVPANAICGQYTLKDDLHPPRFSRRHRLAALHRICVPPTGKVRPSR